MKRLDDRELIEGLISLYISKKVDSRKLADSQYIGEEISGFLVPTLVSEDIWQRKKAYPIPYLE